MKIGTSGTNNQNQILGGDRMKNYLVMLNFMEYIEAESEDEAIEKFSEMYDIKEKYLSTNEEVDEEQ